MILKLKDMSFTLPRQKNLCHTVNLGIDPLTPKDSTHHNRHGLPGELHANKRFGTCELIHRKYT